MTYPLDGCALLGGNVHNMGSRRDSFSIFPIVPTTKKLKQCFGVRSKSLGELGVALRKLLEHRL